MIAAEESPAPAGPARRPVFDRREGARLRHADAERLLWAWGAEEIGQAARIWYARSSAGFSDYQAPLDPESQRVEQAINRASRDDAEISRTGWAVLTLRPCHKTALVRKYRDGSPVGRNALQAALSAFLSKWDSWSDEIDVPKNSL